jgi:hypothetical protein
MTNKIKNLIHSTSTAITWVDHVDTMQGDRGKKTRKKLIDIRRKLYTKLDNIDSNPAVGIFGESQKGKSYLVSSLLSEHGKRFTISDHHQKYDFIHQINPIGRGLESTGLVTRFTSTKFNQNENFPIKAKLFSITDLLIILCDSYYNDVQILGDNILSKEHISEEFEEVFKRGTLETQYIISEDNLYDLGEYFKNNFSSSSQNIIASDFFYQVSLKIKNLTESHWIDLFSLLWNKNVTYTNLFKELVEEFQKLNYPREIYLPVSAILRENGTLLDVEIIKQAKKTDEPGFISKTDILVFNSNHSEKIFQDVLKYHISIFTQELILNIDEELISQKKFLKGTDILDFPGAHHRLRFSEEALSSESNIKGDLLIRGKVAYLFNKYAKSEKINVLMICHDHVMSSEATIPNMLKNWVEMMIGNSPKERSEFINQTKVSPLFFINTKFNIDLEFDPNNDVQNNSTNLTGRWNRRFVQAVRRDILGQENDWPENWTIENSYFQNFYLLRDFTYSDVYYSKLFRGYQELGKEIEEVVHDQYPGLKNDLKKSFSDHDFVKKHFKDPAHSWDQATSINLDGSKWIIQNLDIATENINAATKLKNEKELNGLLLQLKEELSKHFHDDNSDQLLRKSQEKFRSIRISLDMHFGKDMYFLGPFLDHLMLENKMVYNLIIDRYNQTGTTTFVNDNKYQGIITTANLDSSLTYTENLERLMVGYGLTSPEECKALFEGERGIDLNDLFYGNSNRFVSLSTIISEEIRDYFFHQHLKMQKSQLLPILETESNIDNLFEMLELLFDKLELTQKMGNKIHEYAAGKPNNVLATMIEMIADICTEMMNHFIFTVGYDFISDSHRKSIEEANEKNGLNLKFNHDDLMYENQSKQEATTLFATLGNLEALHKQSPLAIELKRLPNTKNFLLWKDYLQIGFLSVCDIPNYDVESNHQLGQIIQSID